jgi:hypothetical protein
MKFVALCILILLQLTVPPYNQVGEQPFRKDAYLLFAADLESDGYQEILIWDVAASEVICCDCTGSPLWTFQMTSPLVTAAAEDLDADGLKEIFLLEELEHDTFYAYRIIRLEPDGTAVWRKMIEVDILCDLQFLFSNVDGKPGKEMMIANRVILERGLERLTFERDQLIKGAAESGGASYFLVQNPDSQYALYTFDHEVVWQGQPCQVQGLEASLELLVCTLFLQAGECSCFEDWTLTESIPIVKFVRYWKDITGDGTEEAVYLTDTDIQVTDHQGTLWTWKSFEPIETVRIVDITGDGPLEIVAITPGRGAHLPFLHILDCTGSVHSFALDFSGSSSVVFSDMDGDSDLDLVTFSQTILKSSLQIYTNTHTHGFLDELEPHKSLEAVDPFSAKPRLRGFWEAYWILILLAVVVAGVLMRVTYKKLLKK